ATAEPARWWESIRPRRVWGLYERMDRFGRTGFGRFITPEDLELQRGAPAWVILTNQIAFGIRAELPPVRRGALGIGSPPPSTAQRAITIRGPLGQACRPTYF